ncbi:MAG: acyl-CoA dehydrogenase family protein [Deltaproteobacteria bacterium]|nr:acyl-CoA dehydrogenase family protein [Deltaproteobacteria bacterium]
MGVQGFDFALFGTQLSSDEVMIQNMAREFVDSAVLPIIRGHYAQGTFPVDLVPRMGSLGFFGPTLPEQYGGSNLSHVAYGLLMQELERGDSGIRSFASVQGALVMYPIFAFGSEAQKQQWLPPLARGDKIGCFGLTEPDHGSDPAGMTTRARRDGGRWILNGTKMWITNGTIADIAVVWARDEKDMVQGFLVERGMPGFSAPEMTGKLSLRASVTSELVLQDVRVPESQRLPKTDGIKSALQCLSQARYGIAWGGLGAAIACYEAALAYSQSRIQFGKPIGAFQLTQRKLVDMLEGITAGQLLVLHIGRLKDRGEIRFEHISLGKMHSMRVARRCARLAREILGANGILDEYPVMRHMMNIESVFTYEGTDDIHTLILGEAITGYAAFA